MMIIFLSKEHFRTSVQVFHGFFFFFSHIPFYDNNNGTLCIVSCGCVLSFTVIIIYSTEMIYVHCSG